MADYSVAIDNLTKAAQICSHHTITKRVNGVKAPYPRWPEAWKACEIVWRGYLDMKTMANAREADRQFVIDEAARLP